MGKILIYVVNDGKFVDTLYHALGEGFKKIGREVIYCDITKPDFISHLSRIINEEKIDFSVGHNEFGVIHTNQYDFLKNFYSAKEHVAILDDAPYNPITCKTFEADCPRLIIACRDRSHIDYLKSITLKHQLLGYFFLPFGALIDKRMETAPEKDINIIFSGMYYGRASRSWHSPKVNDSLQTLLDLAANILESEAVTVDAAISRVIRHCKLAINRQDLYPAYKILYVYCKMFRRNKLVETIVNSGIKLTVCSDTWKNSQFADKLAYKLANSTRDVLALYKRAKILLQDMAEFNDGSHCRVGDAPLCNAMLVSESSKFLQENFNSSEIFFFQWNNILNLPKIISTFCVNDQLRNLFINSSSRKILQQFLPEHRAARILSAVSAARTGQDYPAGIV